MLSPLGKIKLTSQASTLLRKLESVSMIKRIPILKELTEITERLNLTPPSEDKASKNIIKKITAIAKAHEFASNRTVHFHRKLDEAKTESAIESNEDKVEIWTSKIAGYMYDIEDFIYDHADSINIIETLAVQFPTMKEYLTDDYRQIGMNGIKDRNQGI
jgi:hypothetical protein